MEQAPVTGRAGGERTLAAAPWYNFDYGEDWSAVKFDVKLLQWPSSAYFVVGSGGQYYTGLQPKGILFTTWWTSASEKTEIVAPPKSLFKTEGGKLKFKNTTHSCGQCEDCAEGWHASCFLMQPPRVGTEYRHTVTKKFNSWDPRSTLTSYVAATDCGPRGRTAVADLSRCAGNETTVVVDGIDGGVASTVEGCDYYSYAVHQCKEVFDPSSTLVSYWEKGSCGARGNDAKADLSQCTNGASVVEEVPNKGWKAVVVIDGCEYVSYIIYKCNEGRSANSVGPNTDIAVYFENLQPLPPFEPSSTLVSYQSKGSCGPRGGDAKANLSQCTKGASVVEEVPNDEYKVVATIDDCEYFSYTAYECNDVFNPSSTLVSYQDKGSCGPKGDDAKADLSQCAHGARVVEEVPKGRWEVVAMIEGCEYFSYTVYECNEVSNEVFNPSSTLVSYQDRGSCGPRGDDAKANLSQCAHGASVMEEVPNDGYKVVAEINGCGYFSYTVYECDVVTDANAELYLSNPLVRQSRQLGFDKTLAGQKRPSLIKTLVGEMRHLSDMREHRAGGFLESPYDVRYSCLDTLTIEVVHTGGQWRGNAGPWRTTDKTALRFGIERKGCGNVWSGERDDGIHMSSGGGIVGPSNRLLSDSCVNGIKDGNEYDVDCGGGCTPCDFEMISCDDGITNGDEEYIDCGGSCPITCSEKGNAESYLKVTADEDNKGEPFTWQKAKELCQNKNSALAIVVTTEQNQVLTELCGENTKCWIGLYRRESCQGPSCLKWTPREDGSVLHLDQTIFNHWGCHGGGGGTGCYFQYKDGYNRYYMYSENLPMGSRANAWFAAKENDTATVALCGTPPLLSTLPSSSSVPHVLWRLRSDGPWLLDLHFVPFFERDCATPILLQDPITMPDTSTFVTEGSSEHIRVHFLDPTSIGCFRLDSSTSFAEEGGVPTLERVSNSDVILDYSDDNGVTWLSAPVAISDLLTESDARPFPCEEKDEGQFFWGEGGNVRTQTCKELRKHSSPEIQSICKGTDSAGKSGPARDVCPTTCGVRGC